MSTRPYRRYPPSHLRRRPPVRRWRLSARLLASLLLFALVYSLTLPARPWSESLVGYVRDALTWEYDLVGALRRLTAAVLPRGLSLDALRGFWGTRPRPGAGIHGGPGPVAAYSRSDLDEGLTVSGSSSKVRALYPHVFAAAASVITLNRNAAFELLSHSGRGGHRQEGVDGRGVTILSPAIARLHPLYQVLGCPRYLPAEPAFGLA